MELIPVVQDQAPPFAGEGKFHVRLTEGRFQTLRRLTSWPLIVLFFALLWVQVDGQPWLLFSFEQRRIILFGNALLWHNLPLLAGLMITAACLLFFIAVGWGRVWCGFACPQSIWTWLFIRIEQIVEGPARKRAKLEGLPLHGNRLARRLTKHLLWMVLALITATTFTGYFIPIRGILGAVAQMQLSVTLVAWLVIMAGLTYLNAGLIREKICLHACPYSRFQGVMFDLDTVTVSYDSQRGESRASQRSAAADSGDCVDCSICVQVCPTGIDIRDGLQAACIDCGACIDACDRVMEQLDRPKGLIRFASETQLNEGSGRHSPSPRLVGYGAVMACGLAAVLYGFTHTKSLTVEIQRDRDRLFTRVNEETVCNDYQIKVEGIVSRGHQVGVSLSGNEGFELSGPSQVDLLESNASWLPYRVCTQNPAPARAVLKFNFIGRESVTLKTTTFISALI